MLFCLQLGFRFARQTLVAFFQELLLVFLQLVQFVQEGVQHAGEVHLARGAAGSVARAGLLTFSTTAQPPCNHESCGQVMRWSCVCIGYWRHKMCLS